MAFASNQQFSESSDNRSLHPGSLSSDKTHPVNRSATAQYQRAQVETASPTRLVVMLYDGAIRFCCMAQEALKTHDLENQNLNLIRAQRIVGELLSALNKETGGDVASNLFRIYTHVLEELVKTNLYDDASALERVLAVLRDLRESWAEIDRLTMQDTSAAPDAVRAAADPEAPKALPAAGSVQNRLAAKTNRLLEAQRSAQGNNAPSRLGDRSA